MACECIVPEKGITDVKSDKRSAKGVEKSVSIHDSVYNPHCCCGRGIPVKKLKIEYGAQKPLILMVEKDSNAQKIADMIGRN